MNEKIKYFMIFVLSLILLPLSVNASEDVVLDVDKTDLKAGDVVTVTVNLNYSDSLYAFKTGLSFDENVFEKPEIENFKELGEWSDIAYNIDNQEFALLNKAGMTGNRLLVVKLWVKDKPIAGTTEISLNNPTASNGREDIVFNNASKTVMVENNGQERVPSYSKEEEKLENTKTVKTYKPFVIIGCVGIVILSIGIILVNSSLFEKKSFMKNGRGKKINVALGMFLGIAIVGTAGFVFLNGDRGDINGDGQKDYDDAKKINEYLIDIHSDSDDETIDDSKSDSRDDSKDSSKYKKYDVNSDGKITITDTAQQVKKATEKTNYRVTLKKGGINKYPTKNADVEIDFTAVISPNNAEIKAVYINGKKYAVSLNGNTYSVKVKAPNKAGVHSFTIERVVLTNGREIDSNDLIFKVDVLKDIPKFESFTYEDGKVNYTIKDPDNALKSSHITIVKGYITDSDLVGRDPEVEIPEGTDSDTIDPDIKLPDDFEKLEVVYENDDESGSKKISLDVDLDLGEEYTVLITGSYDLDTNELDSNSNSYENKNFYLDSFTNGGVSITSEVDLASLYPERGEEVNFIFTANINPKNMSQRISSVIIDGEEREVYYADDHYALIIDGSDSSGEKRHVISMVILDDGHRILCNYELVYEVLKEKPSFKDFMYHEKDQRVTFSLNDVDQALESAKLIISKANGQVAFEHELNNYETEFKFDDVKLEEGFTYDVKIDTHYDLDEEIDNDLNDYEETLFTYDLTIYKVKLSNLNGDTYYVKKNSAFDLEFNAEIEPEGHNGVITKITIGEDTYRPEHREDGTYAVKITSPLEAGVHHYTMTDVTLGDDETDKELKFDLDVLKDEPTITNLYIDETKDVPNISFTIVDNDDALTDVNGNKGQIVVKKNTADIKSSNVTKGENELKLSELSDGGKYQFDIKINYDLDSDRENGKNDKTAAVLVDNHPIVIYKASLSLATDKKDLYFEKNEISPIYIKAKINDDNSDSASDVNIKSFVMSDESQAVATLKNGVYQFDLKAPDRAGIDSYDITKVVLTNDIVVKAPLNFEIDVLKDIPYINNLNISEDNKSLTYELVDPDDAYISGDYKIINKNDGSEPKNDSVNNKDDKVTKSTIDFEFIEDNIYNIVFKGTYELDSDGNQETNYYWQKDLYDHSFVIGGDYNFTLTNVSITDAIHRDEKPVITFTSTNTRGARVESINIDGKTYSVTNVGGNNYKLVLEDAEMTATKHTLKFESVKMNTAKVFTNGKDFKASELIYTVLKDAPEINNIALTNNSANKTITATYEYAGDNDVFNKLVAILVDSAGNILDSEELSSDSVLADRKVTLSYDKNFDGKYTIKFLCDYDLGDKYKYTSKNIGEATLFTKNDEIYIKGITTKNNNKYLTKGQKNFEVSFDVSVGSNIKTNNNKNYTRTSAITVNGVNYVANQESGYKSKIGITAPREAGVITLTANRVQLELNTYYDKVNNYYSVPEQSIRLEVLRDAPKIENLKVVEENAETGIVKFTFDVKVDDKASKDDESFIDGNVKLGEQTEKIVRGQNEVTFNNVPTNGNLDLVFRASYDLDTDVLNENGQDVNHYKDVIIYQTKYGLFSDNTYDSIEVTDGKAISSDEDEYFEKNERVKLNFKITGIAEELKLTPAKVVVGDKQYSLTGVENGYEITMDGYNNFGVKKVIITDVVLSNGKDVKLSTPCQVQLEVLKDRPKMIDYEYDIKSSEVTITSKLKDLDGAVVGKAHVKVIDEDEKVLYDNDYSENIKFNMGDATRVYVEVVANYDRDTDVEVNSENYNKNVKFLDEIISIDTNYIELKDIVDINLYEIENGDAKLKDSVNVSDLQKNKTKYFVEIVMENMPTVHAEIEEIETGDDQLVLILKYKYVTREGKDEKIKIDYGTIKNGTATNETHPQLAFKILIDKLQKGDDVTLMQDYDASGVEATGNTYVDSYSGKIIGNGYAIKNLSKPLFNNMTNATIENVTFRDVTMPGTNGNGTIAINDNGSKLTKVLITNYYKANAEGVVGTLIGTAKNTVIDQCRATNFNINSGYNNRQQLGGLVGSGSNITIKNSYAQGNISGGWNFRGGLSGRALDSGTYENNYANVNIDYSMGNGLVCGLTCDGGSSTFKNNISLSHGSIGVKMFGGAKVSENNYYIGTSDEAEPTQTGVKKIASNKIDKDFFSETLDFDENIWNLKNASHDNLPTLKIERVSSVNKNDNLDKYREENETLYTNLTKLMPFYNSKKIIDIADKIPEDSTLRVKEIVHVLPVDSKGSAVTYLTTDDIRKISEIKIVYKEGNEHKTYRVIYDNTYDMVASYRIPELKIDYNFDHYVIDADSQVVTNLTNYLRSLDYTENLDVLTSTADSRIYRDFYKETTSKELKEFVLKYLSNSNYTNTNDNEAINTYIEKSVKRDKQIEKVLYMYNYFRRFYDLEIDGMKLYDFMLFNMEGFNPSLTPSKVTDLYLANSDNFKTNETGTRYASVLGNYTNQNTIAKFLEYMVKVFDGGDLDLWTKKQFKGYLKEVPIDGHKGDVQYTLWDHFSNEDANYKPHRAYDMMLPILTLPKNAAYIISTPVQYVIGAQRSYIEDPEDAYQHSILVRRIDSYATRMKDYYATAYKLLGDAKLFNDIHTFHLDKRYAYDENGALVYQQVGTEEPFHKNFNEVTNRWATSDGNAAVAWGDRIDWSAEGLMDGYIDKDLATEMKKELQEYTYHTFTHETAHNIDARLFLKNHGRRFDAGGEDYADSNLMQSFGKNDIVMNLSVHYAEGTEIGSNWDPSRISSPEKVEDYYKKVFETIYIMDYIEAQAFLQLNSEQKAEIGIQVSYPNEEKYTSEYNKFRARQTSAFSQLTAEQWDAMHLETINDLIDNRVMKYSGVYKYASRGSNSYGGEGINTAHWYQPNNPDGRPDSYALKWLAYEMLGYKGYQNGYIEYNSNIHSERRTIYKNIDNPSEGYSQVDYKTDNMAISRITGGKYTNIDAYKKARFEETGEKLKYLKYIDVEKYVQELYDAMVKDSIHSKVSLESLLKRYNKTDTECLQDYWCRHSIANDVRAYPNSTKVRQEIYYTLKNETNDFQGEILSDKIVKEKINFKVDKHEESATSEDISLTDDEVVLTLDELQDLRFQDEINDATEDVSESESSESPTDTSSDSNNENFEDDEYIGSDEKAKEETKHDEYIGSDGDPKNEPKHDEYIGSDGDPGKEEKRDESTSSDETSDDVITDESSDEVIDSNDLSEDDYVDENTISDGDLSQ